ELCTLESLASAQGAEALDGFIIPVESVLSDIPAVHLKLAEDVLALKQGKSVWTAMENDEVTGLRRVFDGSGSSAVFMGLALLRADGSLQPKRLLKTN